MSGGGETKSPESKAPTTLDAEEGPVGLIHPGDRHRLWISKDTQHFCDMENHDHAHESKFPPPSSPHPPHGTLVASMLAPPLPAAAYTAAARPCSVPRS
jgi:hypothetical protein